MWHLLGSVFLLLLHLLHPIPPDPSASTYARSLPIRRVRSARGGGGGGALVELRPDGGGGGCCVSKLHDGSFTWASQQKVQRARLGLRRSNFLSFEMRPECKYQPGKSTSLPPFAATAQRGRADRHSSTSQTIESRSSQVKSYLATLAS